MKRNTIFALSTIFGKSGVAVIRISGPEARMVFEHLQIKKKVISRQATLVTLYDSEKQPIDKVLLLYFCTPNSFTGEDVIEFHTHGSKAVINILLKELGKIFRVADPGEFSKRAFANNKLGLTQAEGLADLIDAETKMQVRQAMRQISGELNSLYNNWRNRLITIMAELEAYIDFPDEDISSSVLFNIKKNVDCILADMKLHLSDDKRGQKLRNGFYISIIGKTNSGKSTLFNFLAKQDLAIISAISGTTRDVLEVQLDLEGYPVTICDTAGIRETLNPIELEGIVRAKKRASESDLILALFDIEDLPNMDETTKLMAKENAIYVVSKADELPGDVEVLVEDKKLLPISVHCNKGTKELIKIISDRVSKMLGQSELPIITRERHRQAIVLASENLKRYNQVSDVILGAEELRTAANVLAQVTGHVRINDVLDKLFSSFCIGK